MFTDHYYNVLVSWEQDCRKIKLLKHTEESKPDQSTTTMLFLFNNDEYEYSFCATPSMGLGTLSKKSDEGWKVVYDPYSKDNQSEYVAMYEAAGIISALIRNGRRISDGRVISKQDIKLQHSH